MGLLGLLHAGVDLHGLDEAAQRDVVGPEQRGQGSHVRGHGLALGLVVGMDPELQDAVLPENLLQNWRAVGRHGRLIPDLGLVWGKQGPDDGDLRSEAMLGIAMRLG